MCSKEWWKWGSWSKRGVRNFFIALLIVLILIDLFVTVLSPKLFNLTASITSFTAALLGLSLIYYLKVYGGLMARRLFYIFVGGAAMGFTFTAVIFAISKLIFEFVPNFFYIYIPSVALGAFIGDIIGKKRNYTIGEKPYDVEHP